MSVLALATLLHGKGVGENNDTGEMEKVVKNVILQVRYFSNDACVNLWSNVLHDTWEVVNISAILEISRLKLR